MRFLLLRNKNESLGKTGRIAGVLREIYQNNLMSSTINCKEFSERIKVQAVLTLGSKYLNSLVCSTPKLVQLH